MSQFVTSTLLALALFASVGCGKAEVIDEPKNPAPGGQSGPDIFGSNLTMKYHFTVLPVDSTMDPQISPCHRQLKFLLAKSPITKPGSMVRFIYDFEKLYLDGKIVGTLSNDTKNFFIDDLVPNFEVATSEFQTRIEMQGHAQRIKGLAFAYLGKMENGQFRKSCSVHLQASYQFFNN